ncbi:hypothetical protein FB451DRAFT_1168628 [Mycena latifolia]|nr:hypothetical protein FB451DRAFT_1168628 [Mycena latifolia]
MATIDVTKVVSKEQFDAKVAAFNFEDTAGRVETPAEEVQNLANLLGLSPGTVGGTAAAFAKGGETCGHCGRAFTFLDIAETGLKAHSKEFLVDVMTGKHGYIVNSGTQPFNCHNCGTKSTIGLRFYITGWYFWTKEDEGSSMQNPGVIELQLEENFSRNQAIDGIKGHRDQDTGIKLQVVHHIEDRLRETLYRLPRHDQSSEEVVMGNSGVSDAKSVVASKNVGEEHLAQVCKGSMAL